MDDLLSTLCEKSDLGDFFTGDSDEKPWERTLITEEIGGFPKDIKVISSNQIYIPKDGFSQAALNKIKRLTFIKVSRFIYSILGNGKVLQCYIRILNTPPSVTVDYRRFVHCESSWQTSLGSGARK